MHNILVYSFVLFYIILPGKDLFAQPFWEKIKTPADQNLFKVVYLDTMNIWAAGDSGVILYSSDKGTTWEIQNSGVQTDIKDIFFLNRNLGWAVTWGFDGVNLSSKILNTTDGGENWTGTDYYRTNILLTTVFFNDSLNGMIGGEPFELAITTDGGLHWATARIDSGTYSNFPVSQIRFYNDQIGYASGGLIDIVGVIWRTTNGGLNWNSFGLGPDPFFDFQFIDSTSMISLSGDIERLYPILLLRTTDGGFNWSVDEIPNYGFVTSLRFRTQNELWAALGRDNSMLLSIDTGYTWKNIITPDSLTVFGIDFADSLHGIGVGERGYAFRYLPQGTVNVEKFEDIIPQSILLDQNYPNPFNPSTKISWQSPDNGMQTLKIFDVLGNEIATLIDEYRPAGKFEIIFNAENLSSGIYYYQLKTGSQILTKKMILLK